MSDETVDKEAILTTLEDKEEKRLHTVQLLESRLKLRKLAVEQHTVWTGI